jgi:hypothetical protein
LVDVIKVFKKAANLKAGGVDFRHEMFSLAYRPSMAIPAREDPR